MNKIREYFIGDILRSTDDAFEQARVILLFRLSLMFSIIFFLPLISDAAMGIYKALTVHAIGYLLLLAMPFIMKRQQNIDRSLNIFFTICFFISSIVFMMLNPTNLDHIGAAWTIFFMVLSAIIQRGKCRIIFCCFLFWLPMIYVVINEQLHGALTIEMLVEKKAENPPDALIIIPIVLTIYSAWANSSTIQQAKLTITEQKKIIQEKNKDIVDSIQYAKRLQDALLPSVTEITTHLPNTFIYYQPKDIVAGDFYWFETVSLQSAKNSKQQLPTEKLSSADLLFIAAADSTGHGVPGAMVSVVCSGALTRSVKEFNIIEPGKILDKTRELVLETFSKHSSEVKDGMDISLLCIDQQNKKVYWSGANNPLWYLNTSIVYPAGVQKPEAEKTTIKLSEIKATKQPVGKTEQPKPFTTHEIEYKQGSIFYLFTDGYADQFGGAKGKKFKYKQLSEVLLANSTETANVQKERLYNLFEEWKGKHEQVDDVCIIGIKL